MSSPFHLVTWPHCKLTEATVLRTHTSLSLPWNAEKQRSVLSFNLLWYVMFYGPHIVKKKNTEAASSEEEETRSSGYKWQKAEAAKGSGGDGKSREAECWSFCPAELGVVDLYSHLSVLQRQQGMKWQYSCDLHLVCMYHIPYGRRRRDSTA